MERARVSACGSCGSGWCARKGGGKLQSSCRAHERVVTHLATALANLRFGWQAHVSGGCGDPWSHGLEVQDSRKSDDAPGKGGGGSICWASSWVGGWGSAEHTRYAALALCDRYAPARGSPTQTHRTTPPGVHGERLCAAGRSAGGESAADRSQPRACVQVGGCLFVCVRVCVRAQASG